MAVQLNIMESGTRLALAPMWRAVFPVLSVQDLLSLRQTSRAMHALSGDARLKLRDGDALPCARCPLRVASRCTWIVVSLVSLGQEHVPTTFAHPDLDVAIRKTAAKGIRCGSLDLLGVLLVFEHGKTAVWQLPAFAEPSFNWLDGCDASEPDEVAAALVKQWMRPALDLDAALVHQHSALPCGFQGTLMVKRSGMSVLSLGDTLSCTTPGIVTFEVGAFWSEFSVWDSPPYRWADDGVPWSP